MFTIEQQESVTSPTTLTLTQEEKTKLRIIRKMWAKSFKSQKQEAPLNWIGPFLLYAALRGKDWRKCVTPCTNKVKLENGQDPFRSLRYLPNWLRGGRRWGLQPDAYRKGIWSNEGAWPEVSQTEFQQVCENLAFQIEEFLKDNSAGGR